MAWYANWRRLSPFRRTRPRAGYFMGGLSARNNREMQAEYIAKHLRARGILITSPGRTRTPTRTRRTFISARRRPGQRTRRRR
jgi:hypothetical protein